TTKAPPTVTIIYPVNGTTYGSNWTGEITGTASSNSGAGTTIKTTVVAIEDTTTNKWWNNTSFANSSQIFVAATGTSTWYLPLGSLTPGNSYAVVAQATDSAGNIGTSSTVAFTYDVTPRVTITYPCNSKTYDASTWTGMITGTASAGPGASIKSTAVAIEDMNTKLWWNGTSFAASTETFVTATGTTTWYLPLPASYLSSANSYSVVAQATDSAGNIGTSPAVTFSYCNRNTKAPPTVVITYPLNGTYGTNWGGEITGTASSNAGAGTTIKSTTLAIEDI